MAQLDSIRLSGTTYQIIDATAIHSLDGYYTTGETNAAITAATNALAESIAEQGYQTSGDVQNAISGKADTTAVTQSINEATSGKVDNSTYTAYTAATEAVLSGKAEVSDIPSVTPYADSVKYNSTSKEVEFYHGGTGGTKVFEYDASPFLIDGMVQNVEIKDVPLTEEATLTTTVTSYTFNSGATSEAIVKVTDGWWTDSDWRTTFLGFGSNCTLAQENGSIFCDNGTATNTGNTIHIQANNAFTNVYYEGNTNLSYFESISAVYGSQTCLVISFNTDAGKQDINIPLTDIFNSDNYYDKTAIDNIVSGINDDISEVSGDVATKQDALTPGDGIQISGNVISVTGAPLTIDDNVTSSSSNPVKSSGIYNFVTGETATKQDILVNQSNIKSINNESLLGSGNITTLQASVSGTTLILS